MTGAILEKGEDSRTKGGNKAVMIRKKSSITKRRLRADIATTAVGESCLPERGEKNVGRKKRGQNNSKGT